MSTRLVLEIFPGISVLGYGFESEGFCVVRGPDVIFGGDVRAFHPPPGVFQGVIGGDPCQSHSGLANLVRAKGLKPSFPDMTPEFQRVVEEARPRWFLRENVPQAPPLKPDGYAVRDFLLDLSTLDAGDGWGHEQMRRRRWWFGVRDGEAPDLRRWIRFALRELPDSTHCLAGNDWAPGQRDAMRQPAVAADARAVPVRQGGSGKVKVTAVAQAGVNQDPARKVKVTAVGGNDGTADADAIGGYRKAKQAPVTGRAEGRVGSPTKDYSPPRRDLAEMLRLQGLPADWLDRAPWTVQGKRKAVGNAVPLPMARELARAIREWTEGTEAAA